MQHLRCGCTFDMLGWRTLCASHRRIEFDCTYCGMVGTIRTATDPTGTLETRTVGIGEVIACIDRAACDQRDNQSAERED